MLVSSSLLILLIFSGFVSVYWIVRVETQLDEVNEKLEDVLYMIENINDTS